MGDLRHNGIEKLKELYFSEGWTDISFDEVVNDFEQFDSYEEAVNELEGELNIFPHWELSNGDILVDVA